MLFNLGAVFGSTVSCCGGEVFSLEFKLFHFCNGHLDLSSVPLMLSRFDDFGQV